MGEWIFAVAVVVGLLLLATALSVLLAALLFGPVLLRDYWRARRQRRDEERAAFEVLPPKGQS